MTEARLVYSPDGDRWEAFPVDQHVIDVFDADLVRFFVGSNGINGFAFDVDGDLESRLATVRQHVDIAGFAERFAVPDSAITGLVVAVIPASGVASLSMNDRPRPVKVDRSSRSVDVQTLGGAVFVSIFARWWFSIWGIWFTVTRGDGLVLADLPIRATEKTERIPIGVSLRGDVITGALHRGPKTVRRICAVIAVALAALVGFVVSTQSDNTESSFSSPVATPLATTSTPEPVASTTSIADTSFAPTATLPPQREPGENFVSADGAVGLDVVVTGSSASFTPGSEVSIELLLDKSAFNTFGALRSDGDQTEAFNSCNSNLNFFREVPSQLAYAETVAVSLTSMSDKTQFPLVVLTEDLFLDGAMVEGCPAPETNVAVPYRVLQRTFYQPFTVTFQIPADAKAGSYTVNIGLTSATWTKTDGPVIEVDGHHLGERRSVQ